VSGLRCIIVQILMSINQLQLKIKVISLNQLNYKAPEESHATEELVGLIKQIPFLLEFFD